MRILFFGLNELGETCLSQLLKYQFSINHIIIPKENRTNGFAVVARDTNIPITILSGEHDFDDMLKTAQNSQPDLIIISGFTKLIKEEILRIPKLGSINTHTSLLPKYRGAHPINWALIHDQTTVGTTIHYVDQGMDTGDILAQRSITVTNRDTITSLRRKLFALSARLLVDTVKKFDAYQSPLTGIKQHHSLASFAPKRVPGDSKIDWNMTTREVFNLIRSTEHPYQSFCYDHTGQKIEILQSYIPAKPGKVLGKLAGGFYIVSTTDGIIAVKSSKVLHPGDMLS
jgi:methionyl-tRNA formyltransferase